MATTQPSKIIKSTKKEDAPAKPERVVQEVEVEVVERKSKAPLTEKQEIGPVKAKEPILVTGLGTVIVKLKCAYETLRYYYLECNDGLDPFVHMIDSTGNYEARLVFVNPEQNDRMVWIHWL